MQPTEDEQIVQDHMMLIQAGARALVAARRAVARYQHNTSTVTRGGGDSTSAQTGRPSREQIKQQATDNRARAQQNKQVSRQHRLESLMARWAAAEAAREHAAHIAEAWAGRLQDAGIEPADIKSAADKIEASTNPEATAERASEQVNDVVAEQLAEEFVDQQLIEAATAAAAAAMNDPGPAPEPASDPDAGKPLTERLRGLMPDRLLDKAKESDREYANERFDYWVRHGVSPADLVDAASGANDLNSAVGLMNHRGGVFFERQSGGTRREPEPAVYNDQKLSELLRGVVPDTVLDSQNFGSWDVADETFEHWRQLGLPVSDLVEEARHAVTPKGAANALNQAGEEFLRRRSGEINRLIATSEVNAGKGAKAEPNSEPPQPPQPAPAPTVDMEVEL
ncbi:hypothetical protein [Nocardia carnea]|uniref:hypothetical protein n=1 Tax=Nocardia carnea TaxID=37328 RepID=UPI002454006C|nr:hypothetical protein [Nocardia carnea]